MLQGKKIVLGVCGGIAAYKSAILTRLLVKQGAEVKVILTPSAESFVTPLTLATLSKNPVLSAFSKPETGEWTNHVDLGLWGDAILVAPATANTIGKMANGLCDNLLLATYLSARCPVFVAPAMDLDMLAHPSTKSNLEKIAGFGNHIIEPTYGELASGLTGTGRMAEPEDIVKFVEDYFSSRQQLKGQTLSRNTLMGKTLVGKTLMGKTVLVTAGPTYEAIDPVRFIGNHSSGKMGFAIAEELANQGAIVNLVTGPTNEYTNHPRISVKAVISAEEMFNACTALFPKSDITVLAAAVADYKPLNVADQKIKKKDNSVVLELTKTHDIAASLASQKHNGQIVVGFALETENETINAIKKLESKNFDLIVLNSLNDDGAGFGHNTNKITIINKKHEATTFELKEKQEVAKDIVEAIIRNSEAK